MEDRDSKKIDTNLQGKVRLWGCGKAEFESQGCLSVRTAYNYSEY